MSSKVTRQEVISDDIFTPTIEDAKTLETVLKKLVDQYTQLLQLTKKELKLLDTTSLKSIQDFNKATEVAEKQIKERKKANEDLQKTQKTTLNQTKQLTKAEENLAKSTTDTAKKIAELRAQTQRNNKENRQTAIINTAAENSYEKLSATLNQSRKRLKDLIVQEKQGTAEGKRLADQVKKLDAQLKAADASVGQFQRNVGNYPNALNRATQSLKNFAGALGVTTGVLGLVSAVKSSIKTFSEFSKANSELKAISGATEEQMKIMSAQAKQLGATTAFTASQVTNLQTEFAKLGFPTEQIQLMTGSTLDAAAAMGSSLSEQAALTGATLKAFGLDASQATRVNDVLSASTVKSALDFSKLNNAMSTVAPVANAFNFSVEDTTTLLGELSNAGFDASSAATATRNILLSLADGNSKLAKSLDEPVKDVPSLVKGLKQLTGEGIDLAEALNLTDKRSVAAFSTFLSGADNLTVLNKQLKEASASNGEFTKTLAETKLDNLAGDVTKLGSAWEGFILALEDGQGAFGNFLRTSVQVISQVLAIASGMSKAEEDMTDAEKKINDTAQTVIFLAKVIGTLIGVLIAYRTTMSIVNKVTDIYKNRMLTLAKVKGNVTKAVRIFNKVLLSNPIGLVITSITALIGVLYILAQSFKGASDAQKELTKSTEDYLKKSKKARAELKKEQEREIETLKANGKTEQEILDERFSNNGDFQRKLVGQSIDTRKQLEKQQKILAERAISGAQTLRASIETGLISTANLAKAGILPDDLKDASIDKIVANIDRIGQGLSELSADKIAELPTALADFAEQQQNVNKLLEEQKNIEEGIIDTKNIKNQLINEGKKLETEASESFQEQIKENRKAQKAAYIAYLNDIIAGIKLQLTETEKGSKEELRLKKELEDAKLKLTLATNEKATANQIKLLKKENEIAKKALDDLFREGRLEERIKTVETETNDILAIARLRLANSLISQEDYNIKSVKLEISRLEKIIAINEAAGKDITELNIQLAEARLNLEKETAAKEEKIRQENFDKTKTKQEEELEKDRKFFEERDKILRDGLKNAETSDELAQAEKEAEDLRLAELISSLEQEIDIREYYSQQNQDLADENAKIIEEKQKELDDALIEQNRRRLEKIDADDEAAQQKRIDRLNSPEAKFAEALIKKQLLSEAELLEKKAEAAETEEQREALRAAAAKEREKQERKIVGIETFLASLRNGRTPQEASRDAIFAVAALDVLARETGGGVSGGEQLVRMNEKGEEFVLDAKTTSALGLDGKSTMNDFNNVMNNHSISNIGALPSNVINNAGGNGINMEQLADKIGKQMAKNMPSLKTNVDLYNRVNVVHNEGIKRTNYILKNITKKNDVI